MTGYATEEYVDAEISQSSALSILPMVAGATVADTTETTVTLDLGVAVNTVPAINNELDVILADVTTPDGRTNPDGLGTLLQVESGADLLVWPGGTIVHGTPPEGRSAMASLVRVGGAVTVVWPPDVVTSEGPGVTAQVAGIEQIIDGEVEVQPGGIVMKEAQPWSAAFGGGPAVFMNPHSVPTSDRLVLTEGTVMQTLDIGDFGDVGRLSVDTTARAGGLRDCSLQTDLALDPSGEPVQNRDGWLVAVAPGSTYGDVHVRAAMRTISRRLPPGSAEGRFTDGTWGVVLLYVEEDPNWAVEQWEDVVYLEYKVEGQPWGNHGMTWTSELGLPIEVRPSSYESLGITLPGTFHRKAELESLGVYVG